MTYQEDQGLRTAQVENNHRVFMHTHDVALVPDLRPEFENVSVVHVSYDPAEVAAGLGASPHNVFTVTVTLPNGVTVAVAADGTLRTSAVNKETGEGTDRWFDVWDNGLLAHTHGESWTDEPENDL